MKIRKLKPSEILTTRDFPVYNPHILKIYFKICKHGSQEILPPTPVIPLSVGLPLLKGKDKKSKEYNLKLKSWLKQNKKIKYLMCDGSHKTTALNLMHKPIHAMILKTDKDMQDFHNLVETGEIFSINTGKTIKKVLEEKARHFKDAKFFESVEDKTKRMVEKKVIPEYMIKKFGGKK